MAETMQTEDDQTGPVNEIRALPAVDKETNAAPHDVRGRVQGQVGEYPCRVRLQLDGVPRG
eukprot:COSAG06_NODE_10969_length_1589_cov_2.940940_1_plen_60_part_10